MYIELYKYLYIREHISQRHVPLARVNVVVGDPIRRLHLLALKLHHNPAVRHHIDLRLLLVSFHELVLFLSGEDLRVVWGVSCRKVHSSTR